MAIGFGRIQGAGSNIGTSNNITSPTPIPNATTTVNATTPTPTPIPFNLSHHTTPLAYPQRLGEMAINNGKWRI